MQRNILVVALAFMILAGQIRAQDVELYEPITSGNVSDLVEISRWQDAARYVRQVLFSPNSAELLVLNQDWACECNRGQLLDLMVLGLSDFGIDLTSASAATWSHDGSHLAVADFTGLVTIYSSDTLDVSSTIQVETLGETIQNVALSPKNSYLAVGIGGPELVTFASSVFQLFDLTINEPILSLNRSSTDIDEVFATGVAFSEDEKSVLLSTSDGLVYRWDIASTEKVIIGDGGTRGSQILVQTNTNQSVFLTPQGFRLISSMRETKEFSVSQLSDQTHEVRVSSIAAHPAESLLAIGYTIRDIATPPGASRDNIIEIWDLQTRTIARAILVTQSAVNEVVSLDFSPDGTLLASGGSDGTVRLWGIPAGA